MKIMIVDDAAFMRFTLKNLLGKAGYACIEAANGQEAVALYQQERPDLVTMDITMPELDGTGALKEIRAIDPQARVIMCSAMGQQRLVMEALQAGAIDFIVKPFDPERVLAAVAKSLGSLQVSAV